MLVVSDFRAADLNHEIGRRMADGGLHPTWSTTPVPGSRLGPRSGVALAFGLWLLASMFASEFHGRARLPVFRAIPTMLVVKDLVTSGFPFELDHVDPFHP